MATHDPSGEQELVALMHAGDAEALDRLARAYGPRLLAVARRCCRSSADAEDAVQSALLAAHKDDGRAMRAFRGEGSPVAWLSTLVARSCFKMNRAAHADPERTSHEVPEAPCTCADPHALAETRELGARLGDALMALPRVDRLLFLLAAEGWTSDELAAHFALTSDAVRGRMKRARKVLRVALAPHVTQEARAKAPPREHDAPEGIPCTTTPSAR